MRHLSLNWSGVVLVHDYSKEMLEASSQISKAFALHKLDELWDCAQHAHYSLSMAVIA